MDGERVTLRTVEPEDYDFVRRHWNRPAIRRGFARFRPRTADDVADFIENTERAVHFLPCHDGEPIGFLWLFRIDDVAGRGELGYWITPAEQGKGYATEAAELGVRYVFDDRGLQKVLARVLEGNDASRRVLEKVGFEQEGNLRNHYYVDGDHVDAALFSLLRTGR